MTNGIYARLALARQKLNLFPANRTTPRDWKCHDKILIGNRRKPDLAMRADYGTQEGPIIWKTLASVCEVKYRAGNLETESRLQIADKAFFVLSSQLDRRYFVGLTLCSSELRVLVFTRGGSAISKSINIHKDAIEFMYILAAFALGQLVWLGYDENFYVGAADVLWLLFKDLSLEIVQPLFRSCSIQGRGTRIMVVIPLGSTEQYILKDCWLHAGWLTDVDVHTLLQDPRRDRQETNKETNAIFGPEDQYDVFKNCLGSFRGAEWDNTHKLPGIPIYQDYERVQSTTREGNKKTDDTIEYILGQISDWYEPRQHIRVLFRTCAVPITWFTCVREFFNAAMGALIGE